MGFRESKNRPVATNFQFLKILALLGQLLVGACLPQTLLGDFILGGCYIAYMPFQILIEISPVLRDLITVIFCY